MLAWGQDCWELVSAGFDQPGTESQSSRGTPRCLLQLVGEMVEVVPRLLLRQAVGGSHSCQAQCKLGVHLRPARGQWCYMPKQVCLGRRPLPNPGQVQGLLPWDKAIRIPQSQVPAGSHGKMNLAPQSAWCARCILCRRLDMCRAVHTRVLGAGETTVPHLGIATRVVVKKAGRQRVAHITTPPAPWPAAGPPGLTPCPRPQADTFGVYFACC